MSRSKILSTFSRGFAGTQLRKSFAHHVSNHAFFHSNADKTNIITLNNHEKETIKSAFSKIEYDPGGSNIYINRIKKEAYNSFPVRILEALQHQRTSLEPRPYIVFDNLPFDEVSGSPKSDESGKKYKTSSLSENLNIAFSALIGEPYSIVFEGHEIVNNLVPHKQHTQDYTGLGSGVELDFHIENAALKFMESGDMSPGGLLLQGVRHDEAQPKTRIADGAKALESLTEIEKSVLRKSDYVIKVPNRWRTLFNKETKPSPILRGPSRSPDLSVAFYPDMVTPLNREAEAVYNKFYDAVKNISVWVDLTPGSMVYIDNRFTLHSRDKFKANYDENGNAMRWVQRTFVKPTLWEYRELKRVKERVFEPAPNSAPSRG